VLPNLIRYRVSLIVSFGHVCYIRKIVSTPPVEQSELEKLYNALRICTDSGVRKVIEAWIKAAKQQVKSM